MGDAATATAVLFFAVVGACIGVAVYCAVSILVTQALDRRRERRR